MLEKLGKKLYTVQEAAELIGIAVCTVRLMGYDGRLPKVRIGKRIYFPEDGIRAFLSGQAKPEPGPKQGTEAKRSAL